MEVLKYAEHICRSYVHIGEATEANRARYHLGEKLAKLSDWSPADTPSRTIDYANILLCDAALIRAEAEALLLASDEEIAAAGFIRAIAEKAKS